MLLYHISHQQFQVLEPTIGDTRHEGEDPRAVGRPVVWLTNDPKMTRTGKDGVVTPYQHEVEVDDNDPDLCMDELFDQGQKQADAIFGRKSLIRWYFYPHPLTVRKIRRWDPSAGEYV